MMAQNLSTHPCQGMGLAKRDLGCSTILLDAPPPVTALELFWELCLWVSPWEHWLVVRWTPSAASLGGFGGLWVPFPGIFVPQPLEATEALCSRLIYSGRTFGHTLAPKNLKWANPQRQQNWGKAGQSRGAEQRGRAGLALSSVGVSRGQSPRRDPTGNKGTFPKSGQVTQLPRLVLSTSRNFVCPNPS